jgi:hypothetical protein
LESQCIRHWEDHLLVALNRVSLMLFNNLEEVKYSTIHGNT